MKSILLTASAVLALASGAFTLNASAQDVVRLGTEGAYAPWNYLDESGDLVGFEIELGNALCAQAGLTCEWVINEWDSIIPNLQAGNYDAIMAGMSITAEREESIDFTSPYYLPQPARFVAPAAMADAYSDDFAASIAGKSVGLQVATTHASYAAAELGDSEIIEYQTFDQIVAAMAQGRLDLAFADSQTLAPFIEGSGGEFVFVGPGFTDTRYFGTGVGLGLREADDELTAALNYAISALWADGTIAELTAKYFGDQ